MDESTNGDARPTDAAARTFDTDAGRVVSLMEGLWTAASGPDGVFSEPVQAGERIVITAREVGVGGGFGWGGGTDGGQAAGRSAGAGRGDALTAAPDKPVGVALGHGAGGGGGGSGRPVAVISIGPDGVQVTPVLDRTKVGLAAIAAWSAVALALLSTVRTLWGGKK